jgi:peptide-methionine (R)-S-oxide reductase
MNRVNRNEALVVLGVSLAVGLVVCGRPQVAPPTAGSPGATTNTWTMNDKVIKTDAEWKRELTPEQFRILRQKGTEGAFTGRYWDHHEPGRYRCAGCGLELFDSGEKFDSGCGWPSFTAPTGTNRVAVQEDRSHSMVRTEVRCSRCGGHLGHVFRDGPGPTRLRYCINSASLKFAPDEPTPKGENVRGPGDAAPAPRQKP